MKPQLSKKSLVISPGHDRTRGFLGARFFLAILHPIDASSFMGMTPRIPRKNQGRTTAGWNCQQYPRRRVLPCRGITSLKGGINMTTCELVGTLASLHRRLRTISTQYDGLENQIEAKNVF